MTDVNLLCKQGDKIMKDIESHRKVIRILEKKDKPMSVAEITQAFFHTGRFNKRKDSKIRTILQILMKHKLLTVTLDKDDTLRYAILKCPIIGPRPETHTIKTNVEVGWER